VVDELDEVPVPEPELDPLVALEPVAVAAAVAEMELSVPLETPVPGAVV